MRSGFLSRRQAQHRPHRMFWATLALPIVGVSEYLIETTMIVPRAPLGLLLFLSGFLYLVFYGLLRMTFLRWESAHLSHLSLAWGLYGGVAVLRIIVLQGPALWAAASSGQVLVALASVRLPFAHFAPAVLLGPLMYAGARDAYALWGRSPRDALLKGYGTALLLLASPLVAYLVGAWWGAQQHLPHLWRWGSFQAVVGSLALSVILAAAAAFAALVLETWRWRRLQERLAQEGWA